MPRDKPAQGGKGPVFPKLLRHWWKKRKTTQTNEKTYHVLGLEESILSRWPYYRNIKMPVRCYWLSCRLLQVLPIFLSASCANIQPSPGPCVPQVPSDRWQFSFFPRPALSWWKWRLCPQTWDYWLLSETEHFSEVMNVFLKSAFLSRIQVSLCL